MSLFDFSKKKLTLLSISSIVAYLNINVNYWLVLFTCCKHCALFLFFCQSLLNILNRYLTKSDISLEWERQSSSVGEKYYPTEGMLIDGAQAKTKKKTSNPKIRKK